MGKPEEKRPLGRATRRWMNNAEMDVRDIGWDVADWIDLAQKKDLCTDIVSTVMNLRVP
jgi:hypothetical protein